MSNLIILYGSKKHDNRDSLINYWICLFVFMHLIKKANCRLSKSNIWKMAMLLMENWLLQPTLYLYE